MNPDCIRILFKNIPCGELKKISYKNEISYEFKYFDKYLTSPYFPLALYLPKNKKTFKSKVLWSIFDGLLPEGVNLKAMAKKNKLSEKNKFELLKLLKSTESVIKIEHKNG